MCIYISIIPLIKNKELRNTLVELHGIRAIGSNSGFVLGSQNKSDLVVSLPSEGEARCQDRPVPEVRQPEAERVKLTRPD